MRRSMDVVIVAALAVAAVGLVSGVEGPSSPEDVVPRAPALPTGSGQARSYRDMRARDYGVNRDLSALWFAGIAPRPEVPGAGSALTDEEVAAALERRAQRRAYDGAPPAVPHAVDQFGAPACIACHERGARIGSQLVAPVMSHARRDSCLQCHVAARGAPTAENVFAGERPVRGERAWAGAPPTIPHTTFMRERCDSCHGSLGALRTSHPWRAQCRQCHAPPAGAP